MGSHCGNISISCDFLQCSKTTYLDQICVVNISSYNVSNISCYDNVRKMIGAVKKGCDGCAYPACISRNCKLLNQSHFTHERDTHNKQNAFNNLFHLYTNLKSTKNAKSVIVTSSPSDSPDLSECTRMLPT